MITSKDVRKQYMNFIEEISAMEGNFTIKDYLYKNNIQYGLYSYIKHTYLDELDFKTKGIFLSQYVVVIISGLERYKDCIESPAKFGILTRDDKDAPDYKDKVLQTLTYWIGYINDSIKRYDKLKTEVYITEKNITFKFLQDKYKSFIEDISKMECNSEIKRYVYNNHIEYGISRFIENSYLHPLDDSIFLSKDVIVFLIKLRKYYGSNFTILDGINNRPNDYKKQVLESLTCLLNCIINYYSLKY